MMPGCGGNSGELHPFPNPAFSQPLRRHPRAAGWLLVFLLLPLACGGGSAPQSFRVVARHPHDPTAFTQGLLVHPDGTLVESTGLVGESSLRVVHRATGNVRTRVSIDPPHFAEGVALHGGELIVLTWRSGMAFRFDSGTLAPQGKFAYEGEGWGLASDGVRLYRSDGTDRVTIHNPLDFSVVGSFAVRDGMRPVTQLNEMEFVGTELWANVWKTDRIVRIDPRSGRVVGWLDLSNLYPFVQRPASADVLNGIAYDPSTGHVLVTGKRWPWVFELELEGFGASKTR